MAGFLFVVTFFGIGCGATQFRNSSPRCPVANRHLDMFAEQWGMTPRYNVSPSVTTPSGVRVDPGENEVDLVALDAVLDRVDDCLAKLAPGGELPVWLSVAAQCPGKSLRVSERSCITIKVVDDWYETCSGEQALSWLAPASGCAAKGLKPDPNCPCRWRSGMQDGHTVVTTPDFYLAWDWYIRVTTGCLNPWAKGMAECANQGRL